MSDDGDKPIAYQTTDEFGRPVGFIHSRDGETRWPRQQHVPLYLRPQLVLTDEERDELTWMANAAEQYGNHGMAKMIRGLLERTKGEETKEGDDE